MIEKRKDVVVGGEASDRQAVHYDRILHEYDEHYFDRYASEYRRRFMLEPLLGNIDLAGMKVADLACGSGHTSLYLMEKFDRVETKGFDISPIACREYKALTGRPSEVLDLTKGYHQSEQFDAAIIIGGLHHCVVDLPRTIESIAAMLKPGGHLFLFEPNRDYMLESVRRIWYRIDNYFDHQTEAALSHDKLVELARTKFVPQHVRYLGGPAFFLILNSMIFRIPKSAKAILAPPMMGLEAAYNRLPGRFLFPSFIARWKRS